MMKIWMKINEWMYEWMKEWKKLGIKGIYVVLVLDTGIGLKPTLVHNERELNHVGVQCNLSHARYNTCIT